MLTRLLIAALILLAPTVAFAQDDLPDGSELVVTSVKKHELVGKVNGERVKVRLLGVDCLTAKSTRAIKKLVGTRVVLRSDKSFLPILKDQSDRFVAYVETTDGKDVGLQLVQSGACSAENSGITHPKQQLYAAK